MIDVNKLIDEGMRHNGTDLEYNLAVALDESVKLIKEMHQVFVSSGSELDIVQISDDFINKTGEYK